MDAYRKDHEDKKPRWKEDSETLRREEMKRRNELEQRVRRAQRVQRAAAQRMAAQSRAARAPVRAARDGSKSDISYATISRLGGGAAIGTTVGTALAPGLGTIAGAVLGGIAGALAPGILKHKKLGRRRNGRATSRLR